MTRALPNILITGTPGVGKTSHCEALLASLSTAAAPSRSRGGGGGDGGDEDEDEGRQGEGDDEGNDHSAAKPRQGSTNTDDCGLMVSAKKKMKHLSINRVCKEKGFHESYDRERACWVVDEDALLDSLESTIPSGGYIIDWHIPDLFPRAWIDLVIVLRTDTEVLYDRLLARGYSDSKLQENLDAEIMQVVLEDAKQAYEEEDDSDSDDDDDEIEADDNKMNTEHHDDDDNNNKDNDEPQKRRGQGRGMAVVELQSNGQDDLDANVQRIETWLENWLAQREGPR